MTLARIYLFLCIDFLYMGGGVNIIVTHTCHYVFNEENTAKAIPEPIQQPKVHVKLEYLPMALSSQTLALCVDCNPQCH